MKRFITFGSIEQFSSIVKNVRHTARYVGVDDNGEAIFDNNASLPVVHAIGTEKIHGTNAAVCFSNPDGFWIQSRKNIITPDKDNAGCAFAADNNKSSWLNIIKKLAETHDIDLDKNIISVFFEWSGGNIQKNSACSGLDKRAIIFQYFKVSPIEPQIDEKSSKEISAKWVETFIYPEISMEQSIETAIWVDDIENKIFNIVNFPHVAISIDFNEPEVVQNQLIELVKVIEAESLVGKEMGQDGNIGEGYVFTFTFKDVIYRFKVKGEKHAKGSGKVKTLKPVDTVFENKKRKFVNEIACAEFRLDQMFSEIKNSTYNGDVNLMSKNDTGNYIRLIIKDVLKEHSAEMSENGFEPKTLNGLISKVAASYFISRLEKEIMNS